MPRRRRPKGIPDNWIRAGEAAYRLGVPTGKICGWIRNGYITVEARFSLVPYIDWDKALLNPLTKKVYDEFQAYLASDHEEDVLRRPIKDPVKIEPDYGGGD